MLNKLILRLKILFLLLEDSFFWLLYEFKYNSSICLDKRRDLAKLMIDSHVIEKGITMPGRRLGFGYERVSRIISLCNYCIKLYGDSSVEIQSTLKVLEQYADLHKKERFEIKKEIKDGITNLLKYKKIDTKPCYEATVDQFFAPTKDFNEFAHQRHSLRWYSKEVVPNDLIEKVVELAMTAPSACNRQSIKVYVISSEAKIRQVLDLQEGNRGFGEHACKLLCVTSDMRCYNATHRPMANVDGGIFTMNLLYALHYFKIAACTLNACFNKIERKKLCSILGMDKAEFPIAFVSIGKAPDKFMVAASQRLNVKSIINFC